ASASSTQPTSKFGTVNALLGGVEAAGVDPSNGDVYYVYGNRDSVSGSNRLAIRRLTTSAGTMTIGPENFVTTTGQAALPSVAVTTNGTIGVFYYTFDGMNGGVPQFTAHLATSADKGVTFNTDTVLETFLSVATDNGDTRQRVLGDYHQVRALGNVFYGSFTGNGVPFGRTFANHDPIFYKVDVGGPTAAAVTVSGRVVDPNGTGLRGAVVRLTDETGISRSATTNAFGYFVMENISSGKTYVGSVKSRGYVVDQRLVSVTDTIADLTFAAR
ncbi:MAG: carboxypeptidase regulatory-like domain-containing protein, partial [Acidobacteria bacterium]|nr:carboxypeptidase regulatory-like domain-containing protein [Acidobacteriota bacterium]